MNRLILSVLLILVPLTARAACTPATTGLGLCYPNFGDAGNVWAAAIRNNFVLLNSSVPVGTSTPTYSSLLVNNWITAGSSITASGGFYGDLTGNAATASALAANPADCTLPNVALGIGANGAAVCSQPSNVTGNAATATKLATARAINGVSFDGSANINIATTSYLADGVSLALTGATFSAKPSSVTLQGNTFNGASQLVKLDALSKLPAVDGSQLTNLPSTSGGAVLASTQTFTGANTFTSSITSSGNNNWTGTNNFTGGTSLPSATTIGGVTTMAVMITTGTYTGDGTNNRAIAHGLGTIPKYVHVLQISAGDNFCDLTGGAPTIIQSQYGATTKTDVVTSMDATNFFVTRASIGACNYSGSTYSWVAFR
jgi:hypothetical protein